MTKGTAHSGSIWSPHPRSECLVAGNHSLTKSRAGEVFQYQVVEMQVAIDRLLQHSKPVRTVVIKKDHAEYLGVPYIASKPQTTPRRPSPLGGRMGKPYGLLVTVVLLDLFMKLQGATGVDEKARKASSNGSSSKPTEGAVVT